MYIGQGRIYICVSVCPSPHFHTTARTRKKVGGIVRVPSGCALLGADLQSVRGFRCYDNIAPNAKRQRVLVLVLGLVVTPVGSCRRRQS